MKLPRIAIAQMNPVVGDFVANSQSILEYMEQSAAAGVDLLVFGELALSGYPLGDLAYRKDFVNAAGRSLDFLVRQSAAPELAALTVVIGTVLAANQGRTNMQRSNALAHNSAVAFGGGKVIATHHKNLLPTYDVFDDWRNFVPGTNGTTFTIGDCKIALAVCEDIWSTESNLFAEYRSERIDLIVSPNGSPFSIGKVAERLVRARDFAAGTPILYVNLRGGQDDLVFDGGSFLLDDSGLLAWQSEATGALQQVAIDGRLESGSFEADDWRPACWEVLKLGLSDYMAKTGQTKVVLGLSGGIDSALCAVLAVDAVGPENVLGVRLPSRYSSEHSLADAQELATRLGIELRTIPIDDAHRQFEEMTPLSSLADENLQARIRAVLLMAISNSEGRMLLSTGNKSEIAVGYSTIYGDAAGGFAPIKDVYKTKVWELAKWRNSISSVIPERSILKPPSAELRPGQVDQDSLPDYRTLDSVLELLVEGQLSVPEVVGHGFDLSLVQRVDGMVRAAEWKRSQGAIGTKVTEVSFGRGRRVPIATRFRTL